MGRAELDCRRARRAALPRPYNKWGNGSKPAHGAGTMVRKRTVTRLSVPPKGCFSAIANRLFPAAEPAETPQLTMG